MVSLGLGLSLGALAVRGGEAGSGLSSAFTPLAQILALEPDALLWADKGAGWQGTSGGDLAAVGPPAGLIADLSQLGSKTLAEWSAAPTTPELVTNGGFDSDVSSWTAGSFGGSPAVLSNVSGAMLIANNGAGGNGYVTQAITTVSGQAYRATWTITKGTAAAPRISVGTSAGANQLYSLDVTVSGIYEGVFVATGTTSYVNVLNNNTTAGLTTNADNISVRELPGNHLIAGTWASPSDSARPDAEDGYWQPDGVSDYMSFLSAVSTRTLVAAVRVPTGYSADERLIVKTDETAHLSVNGGNWAGAGTPTIRVNGAASAGFTVDTWHVVSAQWASGQSLEQLWYSATGSQFGSIDLAAMALFDGALTAGELATAEAVMTGAIPS